MTDEPPADRRTAPTDDDAALADVDAGAFIGREAELTRPDIPTAGEAMQDPNPDPGWRPPPEGHREASTADDDIIKRKG